MKSLFHVPGLVKVTMDVIFGTSSKGKQTVIYRNFEYVKERENRCGTTSWRCHHPTVWTVDLHERDSARHPTPESFVSAGYNWSESPVGKKSVPSRTCMNSWYCNSKYGTLNYANTT